MFLTSHSEQKQVVWTEAFKPHTNFLGNDHLFVKFHFFFLSNAANTWGTTQPKPAPAHGLNAKMASGSYQMYFRVATCTTGRIILKTVGSVSKGTTINGSHYGTLGAFFREQNSIKYRKKASKEHTASSNIHKTTIQEITVVSVTEQCKYRFVFWHRLWTFYATPRMPWVGTYTCITLRFFFLHLSRGNNLTR